MVELNAPIPRNTFPRCLDSKESEALVHLPYIIIDDNQESIRETRAMASRFPLLVFKGFANNYDDGLDLILEFNPAIIFLEIDPEVQESNLSLKLINELYRYLKVIPKVIVTTSGKDLAFEAIKYEVSDYLLKPLSLSDFRKAVLKIERANSAALFAENRADATKDEPQANASFADTESEMAINEIVLPIIETPAVIEPVVSDFSGDIQHSNKPLVICVKSYGDYRFINADDICYLQADNNSTDIHLNNGEMITAFKTLKHFENVLNSPFVRIHNSYIVNIDYVSRIHTGNAVCYIKNTTTKLPFSKSYKENVDAILTSITKGNYLEI
jgi:DNA-binding LytR/AlgR family response regulator